MSDNNTGNTNSSIFYAPLNKLENIRTTLSDYEQLENKGKRYFLLGKGNLNYDKKMKKNNFL